MTQKAKIFMNGASQAVRLPREFRFDADEVCIKRVGSAVLLFPKERGWDLMAEAIDEAGEDFMPPRERTGDAEQREAL